MVSTLLGLMASYWLHASAKFEQGIGCKQFGSEENKLLSLVDGSQRLAGKGIETPKLLQL